MKEHKNTEVQDKETPGNSTKSCTGTPGKAAGKALHELHPGVSAAEIGRQILQALDLLRGPFQCSGRRWKSFVVCSGI